MKYQVTVRHGAMRTRYHTYEVEAADARVAMARAAEKLPPEMASEVELVELRVAVDPDDRSFVGE